MAGALQLSQKKFRIPRFFSEKSWSPADWARQKRRGMNTNLEVVKAIYLGDAEQIAKNLQAALASRFEWTEAAGFPYAGTFHSLEEVGKNLFARLATEWDGYRAEVDKFYDAGDTIIVTGRYLGTYKKSGGKMDAVFAHIWNFQDGKIVKYTQNVDTKKVWDAIEGK
jgi:ketosteroid isomerase-like protein